MVSESEPTAAEVDAAVRRLHWPSPDRDSMCDCVDGLQKCPTVEALNALWKGRADGV